MTVLGVWLANSGADYTQGNDEGEEGDGLTPLHPAAKPAPGSVGMGSPTQPARPPSPLGQDASHAVPADPDWRIFNILMYKRKPWPSDLRLCIPLPLTLRLLPRAQRQRSLPPATPATQQSCRQGWGPPATSPTHTLRLAACPLAPPCVSAQAPHSLRPLGGSGSRGMAAHEPLPAITTEFKAPSEHEASLLP